MTQPSAMLDAIVTRLHARLQPVVPTRADQRIRVASVDDISTVDLSEYMTVSTPGVYVSCIGAGQVERVGGPPVIDARWVARCYAHLGAPPPSGASAGLTRGDLAMNLAAAVATIADEELWVDGAGKPTAYKTPSRITLDNRGSRALTERNLSLWLVTWSQPLELTPRDYEYLLRSLREIGVTTTVPGSTETNDQELQLEGGTPP